MSQRKNKSIQTDNKNKDTLKAFILVVLQIFRNLDIKLSGIKQFIQSVIEFFSS